ncbi:MAG: diguanylate cyclase [Xanthobacteraceae bacterium]
MTIQRARFWGKKTSSQSQARMNFASGGQESRTKSPDTAATQLAALRAIVDDLNYGIVVLDHERRVQFMNRAFRRFWRVPDQQTHDQQTFLKLMYHGRGTTAYAVSADKLGEYVAKQLDLIRTGEERPLTIRLSSGAAIQFRCKALPDGGRLLTYGNVSELTEEAEALERLACSDGLTGLNNRRHFLVLASNEWARFQRYKRPLTLLMSDIDKFKSVNDTYGHDVGDEVIKAVAGVLQAGKRTTDIVGRLGGEEFAMVLPEATLDNAVLAAERFRQLVANRVISAGDQRVPVTISLGVAGCDEQTSGIEELLKQADLALYEAKHTGRNRVCRFSRDAGGQVEQP